MQIILDSKIIYNPNSLEELLYKISKITHIPMPNLLVYHKGKKLDKKIFESFNNTHIISASCSLNGGFPNFGLLTTEIFIQGIISTIAYFFTILGTTFAIEKKLTKQNFIDILFQNSFPTPSNNSIIQPLAPYFFYFALSLYIYAFGFSILSLYNKTHQCNVSIPYSDIYVLLLLPWFLFISLLFFQHFLKSHNDKIYYIAGLLFFVFSISLFSRTNTLLSKYSDNQHTIVSKLAYMIIPLSITMLMNKNIFTTIFLSTISFILLYIFLAPDYLNYLIGQISSDKSICPR